ncbi:MAG: trypsin-like peptidase domain-containing protein [Planctomycetes bacterium]|nr:trypsin-like peptidase domain-containing protein [Planctomycetota bacterium]
MIGLARVLLAASALCAEDPAGAAAADAATVAATLERAGRWVVSIRVERSKDLPPSPLQPRRVSPEGRTLYQRPAGPVSGLLLDREGHVATSLYNVAGEVTSIEVTLLSGERRPAKLLAKSPQDDLALLKADLGGPVDVEGPTWAAAEGLRAGRIVFALGRAPDAGRLTATRGIVSAVGRNGGRAIQTDADLNYGNTGGPIVDLDGRVVAIACFVGHTYPQWGLNSGVGLGTTAAALLAMLPRLRRGEDVAAFEPGFLGVQCDRERPGEQGARVTRIVDGGAAAKAGIEAGDVLLEIDGESLHDFDHLRRLVFHRRPGDKVRVKVLRGEQVLDVDAVLGGTPRT